MVLVFILWVLAQVISFLTVFNIVDFEASLAGRVAVLYPSSLMALD